MLFVTFFLISYTIFSQTLCEQYGNTPTTETISNAVPIRTSTLMLDINGRVVLSATVTEIDIRGLHNGLYFVEAYNDGKFVDRQKVVILK